MNTIVQSNQTLTDKELEAIMETIRKDIGACEQRRNDDYAALANIQRLLPQRRRVPKP